MRSPVLVFLIKAGRVLIFFSASFFLCSVGFNESAYSTQQQSSVQSASLVDSTKECKAPTPGQPFKQIRVVFLNPGNAQPDTNIGNFWLNVSQTMQLAATQLGVQLEILYADSDHLRTQQQLDQILSRTLRPDFLIVVNQKMIAEALIKKANAAGIRTLLAFNELTDEQTKLMGKPRQKYPCWIGEIVPDNYYAGFLLAENLLAQARRRDPSRKQFNLLALMGDHATPASLDRERGLLAFLNQHPELHLERSYIGLWRQDRAQQIVQAALQRSNTIDLIWAANDAMALGALAALPPTRKILIGGLNWDIPAIQHLSAGNLTVDVGGHFMVGGWAMVLLHDYARGQDFAAEALSYKPQGFAALTQQQVIRFNKFPSQQMQNLNFISISKLAAALPSRAEWRYQFDMNQLLQPHLLKK